MVKPFYTSCYISHLTSLKHLNMLFDVGFRNFHCSYPILTEKGDLSGKNLMLLNMPFIRGIKDFFEDQINIIGGGGINNYNDIDKYISVGADDISICSVCFNPIALWQLTQDISLLKNIWYLSFKNQQAIVGQYGSKLFIYWFK